MAAHRYWRLLGQGVVSGSYSGLTNVSLHTVPGGVNTVVGGVASADTDIQSGSADDVFDGELTTQIQWGGRGQKWVGYDFGVGNEKDIIEVAIAPNKDLASRTWTSFTIQFSDDEISWQNSWRVTFSDWVIGTTVVFTKPVMSIASRWWRIAGTSPYVTISCTECVLRGSVGGVNLATDGTAFADTEYSVDYNAAKAFDLNPETAWSGYGSIVGEAWLAYDFGVGIAYNIKEFTWQARTSVYDQNPTSGYTESSTDGINWVRRWDFSTDIPWSSLAIQTFTSPNTTDIRTSALEVQVAYVAPSDRRVSSLEVQVAYARHEVVWAGVESLAWVETPALAESYGTEVLAWVSHAQIPNPLELTGLETEVVSTTVGGITTTGLELESVITTPGNLRCGAIEIECVYSLAQRSNAANNPILYMQSTTA